MYFTNKSTFHFNIHLPAAAPLVWADTGSFDKVKALEYEAVMKNTHGTIKYLENRIKIGFILCTLDQQVKDVNTSLITPY